MTGLQDQDIAELYEQTIEVMHMNEIVSFYDCVLLIFTACQKDYFLRGPLKDDRCK